MTLYMKFKDEPGVNKRIGDRVRELMEEQPYNVLSYRGVGELSCKL